MIKRLALLAILCLQFANTALAADTGCGKDTDRNGSVDTLCATPDADTDGYSSVLGGGTDCDDTDWEIYPGRYTATGCSAGFSRLCQTSGSYSSCVADASFTCHAAGGATKFVDDSGPSTTNCALDAGTYADPKDYRCFFNTGMTGYAALGANDCLVFLGGTYSTTWSSAPEKMIYTSITGDGTNRARLVGMPGQSVIISGPGVSPDGIRPVEFVHANYEIQGFEIVGGYAVSGVKVSGVDNIYIHGNYIHDVNGACGANNCGGVIISSPSNNVTVENNDIRDIWDTTDLTNENANSVQVFRGLNNVIKGNTLGSTTTAKQYGCVYYKHCDTSGNGNYTVTNNLCLNGSGHQFTTTCGGGTFTKNRSYGSIDGKHPFNVHGGSGATFLGSPITISNNTAFQGSGPIVYSSGSYEQATDTFTATAASDIITYSARDIPSLTKMQFITTTTLPGGLSAGTNYWTIRQSSTTARLATSLANAVAGTPYVDITSTGTGTHTLYEVFGAMLIEKNIWNDDAASYPDDNFYSVCRYCNDAVYTATITGGVITNRQNAHYSPITMPYSVFGDNSVTSLGTTYANFAAWSAGLLSSGEVNASPNFTSSGVAQHASMLDWGWRPYNTLTTESSSTGTTSSGSVFRIINRDR